MIYYDTDDASYRRGAHLEQREKLGLNSAPKRRSADVRKPLPEPTNAYQKVEVCVFVSLAWIRFHKLTMNSLLNVKLLVLCLQVENAKQDDAFSDLSNILGELKGMALDMGSEIDRFVFSLCLSECMYMYMYHQQLILMLAMLSIKFRQNKALDPLQDDVEELNFRVKGVNQRTRRLLGK